MSKTFLRRSKCDRSTLRKVERILRQRPRRQSAKRILQDLEAETR